jgi:hypothetical protein
VVWQGRRGFPQQKKTLVAGRANSRFKLELGVGKKQMIIRMTIDNQSRDKEA